MKGAQKVLYGTVYRLVLGLLKLVCRSSDQTHLEVERKFRLADGEAVRLPERLATLAFKPAGQLFMTDTFLPAQREGEMVRIRVESDGEKQELLLTLKKWVATADGGKEREETEGRLNSLVRSALLWLGRGANGGQLPSFSKSRALFAGTLAHRQAVVSLDQVEGLGSYSGSYLEVEVLVPLGEDVTQARQQIFVLVKDLLGDDREQVKQSYQDMLKLSMLSPQIS